MILIEGLIQAGLAQIQDTGKEVGYDIFFSSILRDLEAYTAPELIRYISLWQERVSEEIGKKDKLRVFLGFIRDLKNRGLLTKVTLQLSGGVGYRIQEILQKSASH